MFHWNLMRVPCTHQRQNVTANLCTLQTMSIYINFEQYILLRIPHRWRSHRELSIRRAVRSQRSSAVEHWTFNPMAVGSIPNQIFFQFCPFFEYLHAMPASSTRDLSIRAPVDHETSVKFP